MSNTSTNTHANRGLVVGVNVSMSELVGLHACIQKYEKYNMLSQVLEWLTKDLSPHDM